MGLTSLKQLVFKHACERHTVHIHIHSLSPSLSHSHTLFNTSCADSQFSNHNKCKRFTAYREAWKTSDWIQLGRVLLQQGVVVFLVQLESLEGPGGRGTVALHQPEESWNDKVYRTFYPFRPGQCFALELEALTVVKKLKKVKMNILTPSSKF